MRKKPKAIVFMNKQIRRLHNLCRNIWMQFDDHAVSPLDFTSFADEVGSATCHNFPTDALRDTITVQLEAAVRRTVRQERYDLHRRLDEDMALHGS